MLLTDYNDMLKPSILESGSLNRFLQNSVILKYIKFYNYNVLKFVKRNTLQNHGALSITKTFAYFTDRSNYAIV